MKRKGGKVIPKSQTPEYQRDYHKRYRERLKKVGKTKGTASGSQKLTKPQIVAEVRSLLAKLFGRLGEQDPVKRDLGNALVDVRNLELKHFAHEEPVKGLSDAWKSLAKKSRNIEKRWGVYSDDLEQGKQGKLGQFASRQHALRIAHRAHKSGHDAWIIDRSANVITK
jgi:hypothetical protein